MKNFLIYSFSLHWWEKTLITLTLQATYLPPKFSTISQQSGTQFTSASLILLSFSIPSGSLELKVTGNFFKKCNFGSSPWKQILVCEAILKLSQKAISIQRPSIPTPGTFLGRVFIQDLKPIPTPPYLRLPLPTQCLVICCAVVNLALPGVFELLIFIEITHHFSRDFLPNPSDPSVGVLTTKFQHSPQPEEQPVDSRRLCWERDRFTVD